MLKELKITLISDGSSDATLLQVIKWSISQLYLELPVQCKYADFRNLKHKIRTGDIATRIKVADQLFPFDLCFYHRDAESNDIKKIVKLRKWEIQEHVPAEYKDTVVCLVPVRMMESWLLIDELAIKSAACNSNYTQRLNMPSLRQIETLPDPKSTLHSLLKEAKNSSKRRLKSFNVEAAVHDVSTYIEDFSPLKSLQAYHLFEEDLKAALERLINIKGETL